MTKKESSALKVFAMMGVFACHCLDWVNYWGFLFVSVFFFVSGYGLDHKGRSSLLRLPYLFTVWAVYLVFYSLVCGQFVYRLPHCWFLVVYSLLMLFIRITDKLFVLLILCVITALSFWYLDFTFPWWASLIAFPFGSYVRRYGFPDFCSSCLFVLGLLAVLSGIPGRWLMVLGWLGMLWKVRAYMLPIAPLATISLNFYLVHYAWLYLFGVHLCPNSLKMPWMGAVLLAMACSIVSAYFFTLFFGFARQGKGGALVAPPLI